VLGCTFGIALVLSSSFALAQDRPAGARTRAELLRFAELLDLAVGQVSRPSPLQLMGPTTGASSYLIPGHGAIFVLPARALPDDTVIVMQQGPDGRPPVVGVLRRDGRRLKTPSRRDRDRDIQQIESVVEAYAQEAELAHREAEQAMERLAQEFRDRFPQPPQPRQAAPTPPVVGAPVAPPPAPAQAPASAAPPSAPTTPAVAPPPPPWRYWFQAELDSDLRPPAQVVTEVKTVLIQVLEARGGFLTSVRPEEFLVVAVDFMARGFPFRPERNAERTLVVKARKRDLDERRSGKLATDELRKRIEVHEY
jgi:hypothetical protein